MSSQISKLIAMLGSNSERELLNAVRALRQQLKADGRDFTDLAAVFNANGYARPPEEVWREVQEKHNRDYCADVKRQDEERERAQEEYRAQRERERAEQQAQREREKSFPKERRQRLKDLRLLRYMIEGGMYYNVKPSQKHQARFLQLAARSETIGWTRADCEFIHLAALRGSHPGKKDIYRARLDTLYARCKRELEEAMR